MACWVSRYARPTPFSAVRRPFSWFCHLPPSSVILRLGSLVVCVSDGNMCGGQIDGAGGAYQETQHPIGRFRGRNRPILAPHVPFLRLRQLPLHPVGFRSGSLLVRVSDGNLDVAMMAISGEHIWKHNMSRAKFVAEIDRF